MRALAGRRDGGRAHPARARSSTTCSSKGLSCLEEQLLHDRPERQLPGAACRRRRATSAGPERDPRHDRDRRPRDADLGPDRDRRRAVADRVRQGVVVRQRRAVLRRRDDRRARRSCSACSSTSCSSSATSGADSPAGRERSRSALLMLPIVVRSAEVVLLLVPSSLREAALALGAPRWRVVTKVVLPTRHAGPGHRLAARDRPRRRRDRAAAVHGGGRSVAHRQSQPADEHAAAADLQRHPVATDRRSSPVPGGRR